MFHPGDFVKAPRQILVPGRELVADLFIYLPMNQTFILYRHKGDVMNEADCAALKKAHEGNILILRSQQNKLFLESTQQIGQVIQKEGINSPVVKEGAATILNAIAADSAASGDGSNSAREMLAKAPLLVQSLMSQFSQTAKTPSIRAYDEIIQNMKSQSDPLTAHNQQVSAIAVLMLMTAGGSSLDDLTDIAAAGLVHDIGLASITQTIMQRHLVSVGEDLNPSEKLVYMGHVEAAVQMLQKSGARTTPGMLRIIEHHHENWDGSGFKGLLGNKIYRPARILRIADDVTSLVNDPKQSLGFREAVKLLAKMKNPGGHPIHDPEMIKTLSAEAGI